MSVSRLWTVASLWMACYFMLVGAACGSFVGVVADRLPRGRRVVRPRSHCDGCQRPIAWYDNLPLLSFVLLRGRCRYCRAPIGFRALWLEWACALLFVALGLTYPTASMLALWLPATMVLLAVTCIDIDYFWVPDVLVAPLALWAVLIRVLWQGETALAVFSGVLPAVGLWLLAWCYLRLRRKEALGLGDIKLLAALGLLLGAQQAALVLMLASMQGAVLGIVVLALGGHRQVESTDLPDALSDDAWQPDPQAIPFGPFLALAALEVVLLPTPISQAYGAAVGWWVGVLTRLMPLG